MVSRRREPGMPGGGALEAPAAPRARPARLSSAQEQSGAAAAAKGQLPACAMRLAAGSGAQAARRLAHSFGIGCRAMGQRHRPASCADPACGPRSVGRRRSLLAAMNPAPSHSCWQRCEPPGLQRAAGTLPPPSAAGSAGARQHQRALDARSLWFGPCAVGQQLCVCQAGPEQGAAHHFVCSAGVAQAAEEAGGLCAGLRPAQGLAGPQ